ncbi:60S ribosomal protein L35, L29 [Malassezia arunalokei]|uniref:60S ribosomal protein L35, L29 n=1 Tax=Malassezia arunalokei TaxID=1514897 RepID=A0AAJ6CK99_9BASI|nr:60S ribosomal protein L35, L29 [Malassezia arunalokei]
MALDTTMPQTLERPEALKSDNVDDDDDNDTALRSDSSIDGTPIQLPQRPDVALTRDVHWFSPRQQTKSMSPSHLMPITNHGLALASVPLHVKEIGPAPRSEDRVRAAQRMFHAVANSTRRSQKPRSNDRARPSLSANPRQKTMLHDPSKDPLEFVPTMDGTQHCVIATDRNTFEMVVTPPSPRPDEHEWERGSVVTGVSITSHKMAQSLPPQQPTLTLQPPPFELAPGRALQLAQRIKQTVQQAQICQQARESEVASSKVRTQDLQNKSKVDLLDQVAELRKELLSLRVQKVAGGASSKIARINTVRKNIARVLTVINLKQRANMREFYKNKKFQPLDLRPKKTRALRRKMTKHELSLKTERQHKKDVHFGVRRYVLKA